MKLVLIIGSGAVGKMSVGMELAKRTNLRLFHNHMMIEPVLDIFGYHNGKLVDKLRNMILDEFVQSKQVGLIFTYMWAFDLQEDWDYILSVASKFDEVYCIELVASQQVRLVRNKTDNRLSHKPSKRNLDFSSNRILYEDEHYRLISNENEIPFDNYMKIDNTDLSIEDVVELIMKRFSFDE